MVNFIFCRTPIFTFYLICKSTATSLLSINFKFNHGLGNTYNYSVHFAWSLLVFLATKCKYGAVACA